MSGSLFLRHSVHVRGAFKKFCNSIWCTNDTSKIFMLLFNIITLNTNAYVTFIKQLFYASQIELWWPAVQIRLSTQWPAWSHCHRGTTSLDDEIDRRHWVLGLLSRVGVTTIPIQCSLLQPAQQEQGSKMMRLNRPLSRTWRACNKNSIWLASKSSLINVTYALVLRVIMLNNNIKILLVSFVHHIELQNFLNAPRMCIWHESPRKVPNYTAWWTKATCNFQPSTPTPSAIMHSVTDRRQYSFECSSMIGL